MKRSGFTMIELIFVIVILGILASVAVPKLSATRDDAKISAAANNIQTAFQDFGSYYVSQGQFDVNDTSKMSNVVGAGYGYFTYTSAQTGYFNAFEFNVTNATGANAQCVLVKISNDGNVSLQNQANVTGNVCDGVQTLIYDRNISVGGKRIAY